MLVNTAAQEMMKDSITVNEFMPGPTRTLLALKGITEADNTSAFNNSAEWVKEFRHQ